ncbi:phosphatidylinositol-glycan biosynthesis class F protein-like [Pistacia vera]|uniref:phosphatidylinositol-glycan biosynthesis class F protein-like n=1 Tax=Pistacia vera TaxID=55513 RepID=UPI001263E0D8|nr:phosphatidylinositol-glycan biosynthesis class F protein-like [Pistacia vera]
MVRPSSTETPSPSSSSSHSVSPLQTFLVHLICGVGLGAGFWVAHNVYSINLVSHPSDTLRLIWVIESPIVILLYSYFWKNPDKASYFKAVARGLLGLSVGALINALGAIALGAPVGIQYMKNTFDWSLLMSLFTFVPAASVYGSSWEDWRHIFAHTKPNGSVDYMICLPVHGAVIGAWFGAWPMPLDWERPWQEWPICVSYGALAGYLIGMVASLGFVLIRRRQHHQKGD